MLAYGFIPVATLLIGGLLALFYSPGARFRSVVQHFAAGLILSAMAVELLPHFTGHEHLTPHIQGFAVGVVFMMGLEYLPRLILGNVEGDTVLGKFVIRGVPVFFDGLLLGTLLITGISGFVFTFAISIEQTFVGLAAAAAFTRLGKSGVPLLALVAAFAAIFAGGLLLGGLVVGLLDESILDRVIGCAAAVMLFVVVEEMLQEAHGDDNVDSPLMRIAFFLGFIFTLAIG